MALGSTQSLIEMNIRNLPRSNGRLGQEDNKLAIWKICNNTNISGLNSAAVMCMTVQVTRLSLLCKLLVTRA
jgi:hypothetical protein